MMGDPGLLGFLGKVGKAAIGGAVGLATGGVSGAITGAATPFIGTSTRAAAGLAQPTSGPGVPPRGTVMVNPPFTGARGVGVSVAPAPTSAPRTGTGTMANGTRLACPAGFHPNKASYFLKSGQFVPEGTRCVRNRRRNPLNPRALRKAIGRIDAGKTWQAKLSEISTGKHTAAGKRKRE
jgi:hypothetical protein